MEVKKAYIISNYLSGQKMAGAYLSAIRKAFEKQRITAITLPIQQYEDAENIISRLSLYSNDMVVVIGGDGTLSKVVNGLIKYHVPTDTPILTLPAGTYNTTAQSLGMPLNDIEACCKAITYPEIQEFDVLEVKSAQTINYAISVVQWGSIARIAERGDRLRFLKSLRYHIALIPELLFHTKSPATITIDGDLIKDNFSLFCIYNTPFLGKATIFDSQAKFDDGQWNMFYSRNLSQRQYLQALSQLKKSDKDRMRLNFIIRKTVRKIKIDTPLKSPVILDSEISMAPPVEMRVLPKAIRFVVKKMT